MKHTADVVVIGAGIQGLSAAYHLAKIGIPNVMVVEQEFIGAGSSGRSASMLMLQVGPAWRIAFSKYCFERYMAFEEEFGSSPDYHRIGTLSLATDSVSGQERAAAVLRQQAGIHTEIWTPDEIRQRYPAIYTDDLAFGVFGPEDGRIEAHSIMMGYKDGAQRLGAEIDQGVRATGIVKVSGRVAAVQTTEGEIATRCVVNAAGATAAQIGRWVGINLPIDNRVRNIYVTDAFPLIPDETPFVDDIAAAWYYRKEGPGVLMGMGKRTGVDAPMHIDWAYLQEVIEVAIHRVPALAEAGIASGWAGIRPLTPDDRPILGPVDDVDGYVNSCGWGGYGIMHSPIGGQLIAEYVHDGRTSTFDIEPFLLARFDKDMGDS